MALLTTPSPTPSKVAQTYGTFVSLRAKQAAGKDARLTANEASKDPFVADAYARTGKVKPTIGAVAEAARHAMLGAATQASNGDGRVSKRDAETMPAIFAQGFAEIRGAGSAVSPQELAARFQKLTEGMTFMSESDEPYEGFVVSLKKDAPINAETLRSAFDWSPKPDYDPLPSDYQVSVHADDTFWASHDDATPQEIARDKAIDKAMKSAFAEMSGTNSEGEAMTGKIWTATLREEDSPHAQYYIFGRMSSGELVGLRTWRTWT